MTIACRSSGTRVLEGGLGLETQAPFKYLPPPPAEAVSLLDDIQESEVGDLLSFFRLTLRTRERVPDPMFLYGYRDRYRAWPG